MAVFLEPTGVNKSQREPSDLSPESYTSDPYIELTFPPNKKNRYLIDEKNPQFTDRINNFATEILNRVYQLENNPGEYFTYEIVLAFSTLKNLDPKKAKFKPEISQAIENAASFVYDRDQKDLPVYEGSELVEILQKRTKGIKELNIPADRPFDGRFDSNQLRYIVDMELLERYGDKQTSKFAKKAISELHDDSLTSKEVTRRKFLASGLISGIAVGSIGGLLRLLNLPSEETYSNEVKRAPEKKIPEEKLYVGPENTPSTELRPEVMSMLDAFGKKYEDFIARIGTDGPTSYYVQMVGTPYSILSLLREGKDPGQSEDKRIKGMYENFLTNPNIPVESTWTGEKDLEECYKALEDVIKSINFVTEDEEKDKENIELLKSYLISNFANVFPLLTLALPDKIVLDKEKSSFEGDSIKSKLNIENPTQFIDFLLTLIHESGHNLESLGDHNSPFIEKYSKFFSINEYLDYCTSYLDGVDALIFGNSKREIKGLVNYDLTDLFGFNLGLNSIEYGSRVSQLSESEKEERYQKAIDIFNVLIKPLLPSDFKVPFSITLKGGGTKNMETSDSTISLDTFREINKISDFDYDSWNLVEKIYVIGAISSIKNKAALLNIIKDSKINQAEKKLETEELVSISKTALNNFILRSLHQFMSIPDARHQPLTSAMPDLVKAARLVHDEIIVAGSLQDGVNNYEDFMQTLSGYQVKRDY